MQGTIKNEIAKLEKQMSLVDTSTEQGVIESNKIAVQILGLRKESKQGMIDLLQGLNPLDAIAAQAMGAGKFEKFLVTGTQNKRRGLELGMVKANPLLGGIDRQGALASPFRLSPNVGTSLEDLNRYTNQLQGLIPPSIKAIMPQSQLQQDLAGSMMMRPQVETPIGIGVPIQTVGSASNRLEQLKQIRNGFDRLIAIEESDSDTPRPQRMSNP